MVTENKVVIFHLTRRASTLAGKLKGLYRDLETVRFTRRAVEEAWRQSGTLVFIMASGIVVRTIAPLLRDKRSDPAVVVVDEDGRFAVSLLSGHLGGANERAREIAAFIGGEAVITTASDRSGLASIDLFARDHDLVIEDWKALPRMAARLVDRGTLAVYNEEGIGLPPGLVPVSDPAVADLVITPRTGVGHSGALILRPRTLVAGLGCNRGTPREEIEEEVRCVLRDHGLAFSSLKAIATIDVKAGEPGIAAFATDHGLPVMAYCAGELNGVKGVAPSEAALKATGARAVAEPAAILGAGTGTLLVGKQKRGNVTVAVAQSQSGPAGAEKRVRTAGRISVVGTGPGHREHMTPCAQEAIRQADVIVGYSAYVGLIHDMVAGKEVFETGMTREAQRCEKAVEWALQGKTVAVISGGDPGIYAMAGLVFQILRKQGRPSGQPPVEVIPGISALSACAARLGAPLMHDFASISLSDRLTPWDLIERRIDAAAMADFVIVLYNPKSRGRSGQIRRAREIISKHRSGETPVGIVRAAMREGEKVVITDLKGMLENEVDMQTTVIIGNSRTFCWDGRMITPRGYERKAAL